MFARACSSTSRSTIGCGLIQREVSKNHRLSPMTHPAPNRLSQLSKSRHHRQYYYAATNLRRSVSYANGQGWDLDALFFLNRRSIPVLESPKADDRLMLATSSAAAVHFNKDASASFWKRWISSWLQRLWGAVWDASLVTTRSLEVMTRLAPLWILTPAAVLTGSTTLSNMAWSYTVRAMQGLGPVAVKLCQWVATRRDIFPPHWCDRLGVLHDQGFPHSWKFSHHQLQAAFGDYEAKGLVVDDVVGCGSAAQVYRGRLKTIDPATGSPSERVVAIKVLHPGFQNKVERDLRIIGILADFVHSLPIELVKMLNLPRATANFGSILRLQADLTHEARNLERFRTNFYDDSAETEKASMITFPRPLQDWCSVNVLLEDYVEDAIPIAQFLQDKTKEGLAIQKELAGPLLRAFLKMVFIDNFTHGDLHPGNVMVRTTDVYNSTSPFSSLFGKQSDDTKTGTKRTIVFLDAGIANSLDPNDQRNLRDLFRAVIFNDGNRAGRLMVERAKYERCSQVPGGVDAFAQGVEDIVKEFHDRRKEGLTLGAVRIGSLLSRVLDLCRVHGVEIDPAMASVVISTLVLEGLGRSLSPELNLLDFAKPFVLGRGRV